MVLFNGSGEEAGEFGGRRRQLGPGGIDLGFDVEVKVAPGRQRQHLIESGYPGSWNSLLHGERRIPFPAAVPLAEFDEGHLMDGPRFARPFAELWIDR